LDFPGLDQYDVTVTFVYCCACIHYSNSFYNIQYCTWCFSMQVLYCRIIVKDTYSSRSRCCMVTLHWEGKCFARNTKFYENNIIYFVIHKNPSRRLLIATISETLGL
jgi:hypothetical protein